MARPNTNLVYGRTVTAAQGSYPLTSVGALLVYQAQTGLDGSEADGTSIRNTGERDFSSGPWGSGFTSGVTDPAGGTEGATLVEAATTAVHRCYQLTIYTPGAIAANSVVTFSVYAKAAGRRYMTLTVSSDGSNNGFAANFDLQSGTTGGVHNNFGDGQYISASVAQGKNDYYKCIVTGRNSVGSPVGGAYLLVSMDSSGSTASPDAIYTGDGTSGITIWRPKLTSP